MPSTPTWSASELECFSNSLNKLLQIGAISECAPCGGQFISRIFLVPMRFIINLKYLNAFINTTHFKLEDKSTAMRLMRQGHFMAKLDFKDAYFLVPIFADHRKFLRFTFQGHFYEFNCLCMGFNVAPYVFTKIIRPVVTFLRAQGFLSVSYLDDFLLLGRDFKECLENVHATVSLLEELGFVINYAKSCLTPCTRLDFLGFTFDTISMSMGVPIDKQARVVKLSSDFLNRTSCSIRDFAHLVGVLVSVCPATRYGLIYTKPLERAKYLALQNANGNYNGRMAKEDLLRWQTKILGSTCPSRRFNFALTIFTDAFMTGWGAVCGSVKTGGSWTASEKDLHINHLELLAVFFRLKCFAADLSGAEILLRVDNTTAISYINRMGGVQFPSLNAMARGIWKWCESRRIWIFASYIRSAENVHADRESRRIPGETEWSLSSEAFSTVVSTLGALDIDLFASRCNRKCKKYVSWGPDPDSYTVDAFTLTWDKYFFYAFPPLILILRVLQKIIHDQAEGIVVVPFWPSQPWYPLFSSLMIRGPVVLRPHIDLLSLPNRKHPLWETLTLVAGHLSGKPSAPRASP